MSRRWPTCSNQQSQCSCSAQTQTVSAVPSPQRAQSQSVRFVKCPTRPVPAAPNPKVPMQCPLHVTICRYAGTPVRRYTGMLYDAVCQYTSTPIHRERRFALQLTATNLFMLRRLIPYREGEHSCAAHEHSHVRRTNIRVPHAASFFCCRNVAVHTNVHVARETCGINV